jgi:hypothetical protein
VFKKGNVNDANNYKGYFTYGLLWKIDQV